MAYNEDSSASGHDEPWIQWFCGLKGHEMFCEVERSYIEDGFNLYGLRACVTNFSDCLDLILDRIGPDDSDDSHLTQSACTLYGLIHARYIITAHGLDAMYNKYAAKEFGSCPLVQCQGQPVLPLGLKDEVGYESVKIFCPKCQNVYHPPPPRRGGTGAVDGAAFGTTFAHLFLMTFNNLVPEPLSPDSIYIPRVFGFRVHVATATTTSAAAGGTSASARESSRPSITNPTTTNTLALAAGAATPPPPLPPPPSQETTAAAAAATTPSTGVLPVPANPANGFVGTTGAVGNTGGEGGTTVDPSIGNKSNPDPSSASNHLTKPSSSAGNVRSGPAGGTATNPPGSGDNPGPPSTTRNNTGQSLSPAVPSTEDKPHSTTEGKDDGSSGTGMPSALKMNKKNTSNDVTTSPSLGSKNKLDAKVGDNHNMKLTSPPPVGEPKSAASASQEQEQLSGVGEDNKPCSMELDTTTTSSKPSPWIVVGEEGDKGENNHAAPAVTTDMVVDQKNPSMAIVGEKRSRPEEEDSGRESRDLVSKQSIAGGTTSPSRRENPTTITGSQMTTDEKNSATPDTVLAAHNPLSSSVVVASNQSKTKTNTFANKKSNTIDENEDGSSSKNVDGDDDDVVVGKIVSLQTKRRFRMDDDGNSSSNHPSSTNIVDTTDLKRQKRPNTNGDAT